MLESSGGEFGVSRDATWQAGNRESTGDERRVRGQRAKLIGVSCLS